MEKIRVLIVDDEQLMLRTMRRLIKWDKYNMEVIGEVTNGKKALKWLETHFSDIVITDVGMPVMGGIELIQEINKRYPDISTAVISGYDDFNKVKNAFVSGAIDYVLKNDIGTENMEVFLRKLKQQVLDKKENVFNIKEYANAYDVLIDEKEVRLIIAKSTEYEQPHMNYLKNIVEVDKYKPIYRRGEIIYLIPEKDSLFIIRRLVTHIKRRKVIVGVSDKGTLNESQRLYKEASKAMEFRFYAEDKQVFLFEKGLREKDFNIIQKIIENILQAFKNSKYETIEKEINNIGNVLKKNHAYIEQANDIIHNLLHNMFFIHKEMTGETSIYINAINDKIFRNSYSELENYILNIIRKILFERSKIIYMTNLKDVKLYLNTNYYKNITISQIAKKFSISESYLSHKFKEIYGISFKVYLNRVRINHAKELLSQTNEKQISICNKVGFNSSEHFSRIFKKYVGMSPKKYRTRMLNKSCFKQK